MQIVLRVHPRGATLLAALALSALFATARAEAQDATLVTARRDLLERAQQARASNDHRAALDLAQRAAQIQMTPSLRLFIAEEQRDLHLWSEASGNAEVCARDAERDRAMRNREAILTACRDLATTVRPHLGRLSVLLAPGVPDGVRIVVGGVELNHALLGVPYVVNPGDVTVDATAPGWVAFHRPVSITPGATVPITIEMRRETPASAATPMTSSTAPSSAAPPSFHRTERPLAPWIVAGSGGAMLVASGVLLGLAAMTNDSFEHTYCAAPAFTSCYDTPASRSAEGTARTYQWVGVGFLAGGVIVAGIGVLWGALGGPRSARPERDHVMFHISPVPGGAVLGVGGAL